MIGSLIVGALVLGACGSSTPPTTTTSTTTSPTTTTLQANASTQITKNWTTFFSGQTAATTKIALLQNGTQFAQIIRGQASSSLAKSVTAKVSQVSNVTSTSASVRYSISLAGAVALANQAGTAVFEGGVWKVSDASFCVLLGLEGTASSVCPKS